LSLSFDDYRQQHGNKRLPHLVEQKNLLSLEQQLVLYVSGYLVAGT